MVSSTVPLQTGLEGTAPYVSAYSLWKVANILIRTRLKSIPSHPPPSHFAEPNN
jgi:hypothetical protein